MLILTEEQMDFFKKVQFRQFAQRVLEHVEEEGLGDLLPTEDPLAYTSDGLSWLREQTGVDSERYLVDLFIIFIKGGNQFGKRADVQKILARSDLSPRSKYQRLRDLAGE
jgi:hypothetical protein